MLDIRHLFNRGARSRTASRTGGLGSEVPEARHARRSALRAYVFWLWAGALSLAGCSTEPFQVSPPEQQPGTERLVVIPPPSKVTTVFGAPDRPEGYGPFDYDPRPRILSLCYSSQLNTPRQLVQEAAGLCPQGGEVTLIAEDTFFNGCSIFQPHRATFRCVPGPAPEPKYK